MLESIVALGLIAWLVMTLLPLILFLKSQQIKEENELTYTRYMFEYSEEFKLTQNAPGSSRQHDEEEVWLQGSQGTHGLKKIEVLDEKGVQLMRVERDEK